MFLACLVLLLSLTHLSLNALASPFPPKHEVRAVWITTFGGLDWPKSTDRVEQQESLRNIVRRLHQANFNTIFFQARARGDGYHRSSYEPWAENLTGSLGKDPGWDPLQFLLDEAHAVGMEVHAWCSLYKVGGAIPPAESSPPHIARLHPEWIFKQSEEMWLDPGIPAVNQYLIKLMLELVRQYDIDGIQFDFIRYPGPDVPDSRTYQLYNRGLPLEDWRRANINLFVQTFYDSAMTIRPMLKVGATPVGNFSGEMPAGYSEFFQDAIAWLRNGRVDYLAPQIYWNLGSSPGDPDFAELVQAWQDHAHGRHIYAGVGCYKPEILAELPSEIDVARTAGVSGQAFFRYESLKDFSQLDDRYDNPAMVPSMPWKDSIPPLAPEHLALTPLDAGVFLLEWTPPPAAVDGDTARYYNIYRFEQSTPQRVELSTTTDNLTAAIHTTVNNTTTFVDSVHRGSEGPYYYVVTGVDKGHNESGPSMIAAYPSMEISASPILTEESQQWFTLGGGVLLARRAAGFGPLVGVSYYSGLGLFSARWHMAIALTSEVLPPLETIQELSAMYGFRLGQSVVFCSAGVGAVWFQEPSGRDFRSTLRPGIPLEIQVFYTPVAGVGLGGRLFGNINAKSSYGGIWITLNLGKL